MTAPALTLAALSIIIINLLPPITAFGEANKPPGFIFGAGGAQHATNANRSVRLGEKISLQTLKKRFAGYAVRYTKGEGCLTCAIIAGNDGQFQVSFGQDGQTVIDIRSSDDRSRDVQGNVVGTPLTKAVGSTSAQCDAGEETVCASSTVKGIYYTVADDEKCPLEVRDKGVTDIPVCARISGFQIQ